jgi:hypothetical protein
MERNECDDENDYDSSGSYDYTDDDPDMSSDDSSTVSSDASSDIDDSAEDHDVLELTRITFKLHCDAIKRQYIDLYFNILGGHPSVDLVDTITHNIRELHQSTIDMIENDVEEHLISNPNDRKTIIDRML